MIGHDCGCQLVHCRTWRLRGATKRTRYNCKYESFKSPYNRFNTAEDTSQIVDEAFILHKGHSPCSGHKDASTGPAARATCSQSDNAGFSRMGKQIRRRERRQQLSYSMQLTAGIFGLVHYYIRNRLFCRQLLFRTLGMLKADEVQEEKIKKYENDEMVKFFQVGKEERKKERKGGRKIWARELRPESLTTLLWCLRNTGIKADIIYRRRTHKPCEIAFPLYSILSRPLVGYFVQKEYYTKREMHLLQHCRGQPWQVRLGKNGRMGWPNLKKEVQVLEGGNTSLTFTRNKTSRA